MTRFLNHYLCPGCGNDWMDQWDCQVDDDCPSCGKRHISPTDSEDLDDEDLDELALDEESEANADAQFAVDMDA